MLNRSTQLCAATMLFARAALSATSDGTSGSGAAFDKRSCAVAVVEGAALSRGLDDVADARVVLGARRPRTRPSRYRERGARSASTGFIGFHPHSGEGTNRLLSGSTSAGSEDDSEGTDSKIAVLRAPARPAFQPLPSVRARRSVRAEEPRPVTATPDERRMTKNGMGYESIHWDPITEAFARTPLGRPKPVLLLDAGCGYGRVSRAAAANGATVVCNDLDARHLVALAEEIDPAHRGQFLLHSGNFLVNFPIRYPAFDAILISRMGHFLSPKNFMKMLHQVFRILVPGGRLHITTATPYLLSFKSFIPVYEERKANGDPWPGYIDGRREKVTDYFREARGRYPDSINLLDPDIMNRALEEARFEMTQPAEWMPNPDTPPEHALDGRELVGAIVTRPLVERR
jgi:SAM-dependent methyltransferase